jgi:hypothetical protein
MKRDRGLVRQKLRETPLCCNCGARATHAHHIVPIAVGGLDTLDNLASLCDECHGSVHGVDFGNLSALTKAGLQKAKARGVVLGGWRGGAGTVAMNQRRSAECDANFEQVKAMVAHLRERGASLREVVRHLDAYGVRTSDGTPYSLGQVHRVVERLTKVDDSTTAVLTSP